jgi:hypothetical protein
MQGPWLALTEAEARFRTLELSATLSTDGVPFRRIMKREVEEHRRRFGPKSAAMLTVSGGKCADRSDDRWTRQGWHVWWVPPTHWREEVTFPGYPPTVIVVRPDVSLSWISGHNTLYTSQPQPPVTGLPDRLRRLFRRMRDRKGIPFDNMSPETIAERVANFPLISPGLPAAEWELTTLGREEYLGRAVRRVHARRRPSAVTAADHEQRFCRPEPKAKDLLSGYWSWLDEYDCLVDDALQVLLHLTGKAEGVPVGIVSVDELRVDAPIPDDVFAFTPPAGARVVQTVGGPRQH